MALSVSIELHNLKAGLPAEEDAQEVVGESQQKRYTSRYSPRVWNGLWKVHITQKALREYDRRIGKIVLKRSKTIHANLPRLLRSDAARLRYLSTSGGLSLDHLRGVGIDCHQLPFFIRR